MSTIQNLFEQAQLAEAAYSKFVVNGNLIVTSDELITALTTGDGKFSAAQAAAFAKDWSVISQQSDTGSYSTTSGFSATLFKRQ